MASQKSVIVLTPNGRRQNVKVTPNTTMLQVLEEVCQKHEYSADEFDLKHYNKVLDIHAIFRFTGLVNNALLEMIPCAKQRSKCKVVIGIQLENGQRLIGEYMPDTNLAEILKHLCPDQNFNKAVLIYMHREICGINNLESTTLKQLGLTTGSAILRLVFRDSHQLETQINVCAPLIPKLQETANNAVASTSAVIKTIDEDPVPACDFQNKQDQLSLQLDEVMEQSFEEVKFPGDRNGLVFNQANMPHHSRKNDELPDDFYCLTVNDAKILLRDAKRRREELEEAPLLTVAQRRYARYKRMMDQLQRYQHTVIRVQFPDQFVLQGTFASLETVQAVKDFTKNYLEDPNCEFSIYITPPKQILDPQTRLIKANLVPSAIVHYSGPSALRTNVKENAVHPHVAEHKAMETRLRIIQQNEQGAEKDKIEQSTKRNERADSKTNDNMKPVPKWFNLSSK